MSEYRVVFVGENIRTSGCLYDFLGGGAGDGGYSGVWVEKRRTFTLTYMHTRTHVHMRENENERVWKYYHHHDHCRGGNAMRW